MSTAASTSSSDMTRRVGRPIATDRAAVARTALALFEERGYDSVSMADIAEAAGVGRRSLFRHARSKADLVWDGAGPAADEMGRRLRCAPAGVPMLVAYREAFVGAMESAAVDLVATRSRLRLIVRHAELRAAAPQQLAEIAEVLSGFVEDRRPELGGTVGLQVVAEALGAASFAALRWWATAPDERGEPSLREAVEEALEALAVLCGPASAS